MQLEVFSINGSKVDTIEVSDNLFDRQFNEPLIHQVVVSCLAGKRQGTHKQKTRAEVSGGGSKPWKQKGSGRARAGTIRSPLWRHGGVTFAAVPGDYSKKINKKMYKGAILSIFSQLMRDKYIVIIDELQIKEPKTKEMVQVIKQLNLKNPLIIVENKNDNQNLILAARNIPHVKVMGVNLIDPVALLNNENVLITKAALLKLNEELLNA